MAQSVILRRRSKRSLSGVKRTSKDAEVQAGANAGPVVT